MSKPSGASRVEWLPDMDSNHDWVSQSHLCYHYTIGQKMRKGHAAPPPSVVKAGNTPRRAAAHERTSRCQLACISGIDADFSHSFPAPYA
jgi:hypothetical protein